MLLRVLAALVSAVTVTPLVLLHLLYRFLASKRKSTFFSAAYRERACPRAVLQEPSITVVSSTGQLVRALTAGDPEKPLMLLLHGFPESARSWRHVMKAFCADYFVVAIDMPGYGASTRASPSWWTADDYSLPRLVEGVVGVVRGLARTHVEVLVGHDWGAMVAWCVAGAHPDLVRRLVAINVPHPRSFSRNMSLSQALKSWYILFFQCPVIPELYLAADDYAFLRGALLGRGRGGVSRREHVTEEDVEALKWSMSRAGALTAALNYYRALPSGASLAFNRRGWVEGYSRDRRLRMPVLQLWGTADAFLGAELTRGTGDFCEDFTLVELPGCSHWVQQDHVAEAVAHLRVWLVRKGLQGSASSS